jgi:hypothetical protein
MKYFNKLICYIGDIFWDCRELFVLVFLVIAGIVGVCFSVDLLSQRSCNNYERLTGTETQYERFDSCYVRTSAGFQRWDEYKARAVASEGLQSGCAPDC